MVYNFLDTKFGKRLSMIVVPLYLGITVLSATGFSTSNYLDKDMNSNTYIANSDNYSDLIRINNAFADRAAIPSKVIGDPYLNVFVVYGSSVEDDVFYFNKELEPTEDKRGIYSAFSEGVLPWSKRGNLETYMKTIEEMYTLSIDTIDFKPKFVFALNSQKQMGFETFLDLQNIRNGKHILKVQRKEHDKDSIYLRTVIKIPFWHFRK